MEHSKALDLFKLGSNYSQSELDILFQFEKRLLAQKLVNPIIDIDQSEAIKDEANTLTDAHKTLSKPKDNNTYASKSEKIKQLIKTIIALSISAVLLFFAFTILSQKKLELEKTAQLKKEKEAEQARKKQEQTIKHKETNKTSITPNFIAQKKSEQQIKLDNTLATIEIELTQWQSLSKGQNISIPPSISTLKIKADKLLKTGSEAQAQFLYNDYLQKLSEHKLNVSNFLNTFSKNDILFSKWTALSKKENFKFEDLDNYESQFRQVKKDLSQGDLPSYSRATLENANLIIEMMIQRGTKISDLRRKYYKEKGRWRNRIANRSFYKMTPAIKSLINKAEQKTLNTKDFTELETETFPRLLNHFKQTR